MAFFGAAGDDDAGGGWCGVELVTVRLGVCGYLQLSRRVSLSLSLTGSVQHFQSLAVESDRGGLLLLDWLGMGAVCEGGVAAFRSTYN